MEDKNIKNKNEVIVVFLIFLMAVIAYSFFWGPVKKYADSLYPARSITVSADEKITVSPDIAKVSFAVVTEGSNPQKISQDNNQKMNKAIEFIKSRNIDEKDIKTTQYDLQPNYEYNEEIRKSFISGYALTQTVSIKIRDLSRVAEIFGGLTELGINQINSISFEVDDSEKYLAEARNKAFEKARNKAKEMAAQNGVNLGRVTYLSEYGTEPYYQRMDGYGGALTKEAVISIPSIQPGSQELTIQVNITYEIK